MEGKNDPVLGKGSFGAKEGAKYLKNVLVWKTKSKLAEVELSNAVPALKNWPNRWLCLRRAHGLPPNVIEAASSTGVTVVSLSDEQVTQSKRTKLTIPAGTYAGQGRRHHHYLTSCCCLHHHRNGGRHGLPTHQNLLGTES